MEGEWFLGRGKLEWVRAVSGGRRNSGHIYCTREDSIFNKNKKKIDLQIPEFARSEQYNLKDDT